MSEFLNHTLKGLSQKNKKLNPKWLYDHEGSKIFEQITKLDEYYVTRTEIDILRNNQKEISDCIGEGATIIEPGAGASEKIKILLKSLKKPKLYVPSDISKTYIEDVAKKLQKTLPEIDIEPLVFDFQSNEKIPDHINRQKNLTTFFPGSTIGNFDPQDAIQFLKRVKSQFCSSKMIIGVDLVKNKKTLEKAYNDELGVTSKFNKNILKRMNKELDANFDLDSFKHNAFFNEEKSRIEMHLVSRKKQNVSIGKTSFLFQENEYVHTESSYKYSLDSFNKLASEAGWSVVKVWMDRNKFFSVQYLIQK
jgi:dimethylhistidine N-methyltransferase